MFKFAVFLHKNSNGKHFDIRLASYEQPDIVYSWSSRKNPLDKNYPVPMRRMKDHSEESISSEDIYKTASKKTNTYVALAECSAELVEINKKAGLTFETEERTFRVVPHRGKKYFFHIID